jgi:hypothetical protein
MYKGESILGGDVRVGKRKAVIKGINYEPQGTYPNSTNSTSDEQMSEGCGSTLKRGAHNEHNYETI